eukprot:7442228-Heterocapsa_arctica.AAC.1
MSWSSWFMRAPSPARWSAAVFPVWSWIEALPHRTSAPVVWPLVHLIWTSPWWRSIASQNRLHKSGLLALGS